MQKVEHNIQCFWCWEQFSGENKEAEYEAHKDACYKAHEANREKYRVKNWDGVI